ncbi:hypothetical protein OsI_22302 [Oryza sativa Indica Group]|uniref:Uncharacterized protein n=1 Tax=Oryza sativa subsp. indica TaxID=39946 RepID=B8B4F1_ORYSI|nr:hypothetical protein OsI_22302 [Oryza sativa Indica Group]
MTLKSNLPEFVTESFHRSKPLLTDLMELGVLAVPFSTDGNTPDLRLLDGQKKQANVSPDSPVYLSLRPDSRVRGSDVGYPPWQAFVAQLPPVKGMWSDLLNGMDGRVSPWASNRPWRAGS